MNHLTSFGIKFRRRAQVVGLMPQVVGIVEYLAFEGALLGLWLVGSRKGCNVFSNEVDGEHTALARVGCREAGPNSLGAHSATGRIVDGVRARTG